MRMLLCVPIDCDYEDVMMSDEERAEQESHDDQDRRAEQGAYDGD